MQWTGVTKKQAQSRAMTVASVRKVVGWPKKCKLTHAFLWEYSCKWLKLAQLLGQLGVVLAPGVVQLREPAADARLAECSTADRTGLAQKYREVPLERVIENPKLIGKHSEMSVFNEPF